MHDPEDSQSLEQGHYFREERLEAYSFKYRSALYRISEGHRLPLIEECPYLVFMLLTKKPGEMDAIRSPESIAQFREEAGEWVDENKLSEGAGWNELHALYKRITEPVEAAEAIEPAPTTGRRKRGK